MHLEKISLSEKQVLLNIAKIQIKSLEDLLNNNSGIDLPLWAIENEVDLKEITKETQIKLKLYYELQRNPKNLLIIFSSHELGVIKHILFNFLKHKKYKKAKRNIWRKILLAETFLFSLN